MAYLLSRGGVASYRVEELTSNCMEGHTSFRVEELTSYRVEGHNSYRVEGIPLIVCRGLPLIVWRGILFIVSGRYPGDLLFDKLLTN